MKYFTPMGGAANAPYASGWMAYDKGLGLVSAQGSPSIGHPKNPDNRLYLFFITEETMRNHTWEEIWKDQLYVKKDSVTEEEMEKTLWRYTYFPPTLSKKLCK